MKEKRSLAIWLWPLLVLIAISFSHAWAQDAPEPERTWPPVACEKHFGFDVDMIASPGIVGGLLKSITLSFTRPVDTRLKILPSHIAFFSLPQESSITPLNIQFKPPQEGADGKVIESVEFFLASTPSMKNVAFALEEGALYFDPKGWRRRTPDLGKSLRLMDIASAIQEQSRTHDTLRCPTGLSSWKPKEPLSKRLESSDPAIGSAAADELLRDADITAPEWFLTAAYQLFRVGRRDEAVFWLYAGLYRVMYSGQESMALGYTIGATQPIQDYARSTPGLLPDTLQKVVLWDEKSFPLWLAEQESDEKAKAAEWHKNRKYQKEDTLEYVRQLRRDPNARPFDAILLISPANPLREALDKDDSQTAKAIIRAGGIDLNRSYPYKSSYLHLAAHKGDLDLIALMIAKGANTEAVDEKGSTPLAWARELPAMRVLLEHGANANHLQGLDNETLLYRLVSSGLNFGYQINKKNDILERIELLLAHGADVMKGNADGDTPLHAAARHGKVSLVQFFLDRGADVNAATLPGRDREFVNTPLANACDLDTAKLLLSRGATVKPAHADAPLLAVARAGCVDVVNLLLDAGSDPDAVSNSTQSNALYYAISRSDKQNLAVTEALIKKGANVNAKVRDKSMLAWANSYRNPEAAKLLQAAGAQE